MEGKREEGDEAGKLSPALMPLPASTTALVACQLDVELEGLKRRLRLTYRVAQPIEGIEIRAHASLRDAESGDKVPGVSLQFCWVRGQNSMVCEALGCERMSSLQCLPCLRKRRVAYFCSTDCMSTSWLWHAEEHVSSEGDGVEDGALEEVAAAEDVPMWEEKEEEEVLVCHGEEYVPVRADVGYHMKVECKVVDASGKVIGDAGCVKTHPVVRAAPPLPPRVFLRGERPVGGGRTFRVLDMNILAEIYATQSQFPYAPMWALTWNYRRRFILVELLRYAPDVICLQEVQANHFEDFFYPKLKEAGYDGLFKKKTREAMGMEGQVDGCALFFNASKFALREKYVIEFNDAARKFMKERLEAATGHKQKRRLTSALKRLLKDNIAQVVVLETLATAGGEPAGQQLCVANTHIYADPKHPDVKLWQTHMLVKEVEKFVRQRNLPLLLCGDFNSLPDSSVYSLLQHKRVPDGHPDLARSDEDGFMPSTALLTHGLPLASAQKTLVGAEPDFTNYTVNFQGVVDYVWFTADSLRVIASLQPPTRALLRKVARTPIPNCQYPSDHISLCFDFVMLPPRRPVGV